MFIDKCDCDDGSSVNRSLADDCAALFDFWPAPVWYSGDSDLELSWNCEDRDDTLLTKFSVRDLLAWMFFVRTSSVSLKFAATSATLFCSSKTTFLLCCPS